jgi:hypothetical protein
MSGPAGVGICNLIQEYEIGEKILKWSVSCTLFNYRRTYEPAFGSPFVVLWFVVRYFCKRVNNHNSTLRFPTVAFHVLELAR